MILVSPLFDDFSRWSLVKETAVTRLANASSKDGRMVPSTSSKKDLGVFTPLVTAERERVYFLYREGSFLRKRRSFSCLGILGVSAFFLYLFLI